MDFYDQLADNYAELTDASGRRIPAERFVEQLIRRFDISSAIDVACGAGLFAIELARRGVRVVGSDISSGMLASARSNAAEAEIDAGLCSWVQTPMQELSNSVSSPVDAVICMGNSIPHLLTDDDLDGAIQGFAGLLSDSGVLAIHLLNYEGVFADDRIVGITRSGTREFVRFYDFHGDLIDFNILEIEWTDDGQCSHKLLTTPLRPYLHTMLIDAMARAGFGGIEAFGDLQFGPFDAETSDTLLLTATRSPR